MLLLGNQGVQLPFLLHILLSAGESRNLTVSQTPSVIKALKGQTVKINCLYNSEDEEQFRIKWGKNNSAQKLCDYTYNQSKRKYTSWHCTERVNITLDLSTNSSSLIIYNLHLNDSDIYFCKVSIEIPPPTQTAQGSGTHLTVEARPTVQLRAKTLPFPNEGMQLVCASLGFYPVGIRMSWFKEGQLITNETDDGTLYTNSDGSFSITGFLNLSVSDWNEGANYSCQVNHSTLPTPITKWISVRNPDETDGNSITRTIVLRVTILGVATLILMVAFALYFRLHDIDDEFEPPSLCQMIKHQQLQTDLIRATSDRKQDLEVHNSLVGK